jgi:hypothetical protein
MRFHTPCLILQVINSFDTTFVCASTGHANGALVTDAANAKARHIWEGQLGLVVKDGSLKYAFENKGSMFDGRGFEMLAALNRHCHPESVSNIIGSLHSSYNDMQGKVESIQEYCSCFDGLINNLSHCKVGIPPRVLVMLFLQALHGHCSNIMDQFWSCFKSLDTTTINLVIEDVQFHDSFTLHNPKNKSKSPTWVPAAAAANTDRKGNVWQTPFEWLENYGKKVIKTHWTRALASSGVCPICHKVNNPWHVPAVCPLLKDLNLKLIRGPPQAGSPAPAGTPAPLPSLAPSPSPGICAAMTDSALAPGLAGSAVAPLGLTAMVLPAPPPSDDFDTDNEFIWSRVKHDYAEDSNKLSNNLLYSLPSCFHVYLVQDALPITLPTLVHKTIKQMSWSGLAYVLCLPAKLWLSTRAPPIICSSTRLILFLTSPSPT